MRQPGRRGATTTTRREPGGCAAARAGFFFQAEDGIRYGAVTGVQTCALPISSASPARAEYWSRLLAICLGVNQLRVGCTSRQAAFLGGELQGFFAVELGLADELLDAVGEALRGICLCACVGRSFGAD